MIRDLKILFHLKDQTHDHVTIQKKTGTQHRKTQYIHTVYDVLVHTDMTAQLRPAAKPAAVAPSSGPTVNTLELNVS